MKRDPTFPHNATENLNFRRHKSQADPVPRWVEPSALTTFVLQKEKKRKWQKQSEQETESKSGTHRTFGSVMNLKLVITL